MLTIVSIVHPDCVPSIDEALAVAAAAAGEFIASTIVPDDQPAGPHTRTLRVHGGRKRLARYRGLRRVLRELQPDVLHVQADPCSLLALQVAWARRRHHAGSALVIECGHAVAATPFWPFSHIRRRVLAAAGAAIVRHGSALRRLAAAGFDGNGFIIGPRVMAPDAQRPARAEVAGASLVVGYAGPLEAEFGLIDLLEGVAACRPPVALVIQGGGSLRSEIEDRAASLDAADRVHLLDSPSRGDEAGDALLALVDALVVMPRARHATRAAFDRSIAAAQCRGVPVIVSAVGGLGEMVGEGGWLVEPGDPARLACLLQRIAAAPGELARVTEATRREAANRYSSAMLRDGLRRAFESAWISHAAPAPAAPGLTAITAQLRSGD